MRSTATNRRAAHARERNASDAMARLLTRPPPLAPSTLACGTQLTRRWTRDGFDGYAPAMAGHLVATYHGRPQDCTWRMEQRRLAGRLRPGAVTVVAEGHDGRWRLVGPVDVSHVYLTDQRLQSAAEIVGGGRRAELQHRLGFDDPAAAHLLGVVSEEDVQRDGGARLLIDRAVDLLCIQLLRRHCAGGMPGLARARGGLAPWQLRRVTDYMLAHLDRPIGLEELAGLARLSRYHFCTAFRVATGRTPHAWLAEQRMARARRLLADPELSVREVGLAVGYATSSAFVAGFRRIVGVTPSGFRRDL